jgi:hypothetical protein
MVNKGTYQEYAFRRVILHSFCYKPGSFGHPGEYLNIRAQHPVERFRRAREDLKVHGLKSFPDLGKPEDANDLLG